MPHQYHSHCYSSISFAECKQYPDVVVISCANPSFYGRRLRAMLGFAKNYFPSVLVVTPGICIGMHLIYYTQRQVLRLY